MKSNLLPWRDTDRQQKLAQFSAIFLLGLVCGGGIGIMTHSIVNKKLQQLNQANQQILQNIVNQQQLLLQSKEINNQQQQLGNFIQQAKLIRLKQQRVLLFLVNLPQWINGTLYLTNIKKQNDQIAAVGLASNYQEINRLVLGIQQQVGRVQLIKAHKINSQIKFEMSASLQ